LKSLTNPLLKDFSELERARFTTLHTQFQKNHELEKGFFDILDKFFLMSNQEYYSAMIR